MDESSQQRKKNLDAIVAAISTATMGAGIAAAAIAAGKYNSASVDAARIEKSISELNSKFDRIAEQLKSIHPEISATAKEVEKRQESVQQPHKGKPQQEVIYVRKSSEFSFYN